MSSTMTAEMVRGGLNPLLERAEHDQSLTPAEAREMLQYSAIPLFLLESLWDQAKTMMGRGAEHGSVVAVVNDLSTLIERCTNAFEDAAIRAPDLGLGSTEVASLNGTVEKLKQFRAIVSDKLHWLQKPPPHIDPAALPPRSDERTSAGFVTGDDLAARLRAPQGA